MDTVFMNSQISVIYRQIQIIRDLISDIEMRIDEMQDEIDYSEPVSFLDDIDLTAIANRWDTPSDYRMD